MKQILGHLLAWGVIATLLFAYLRDNADNLSGSYPAKPIKVVVPFGAGGGSDTFGRMMQHGIKTAGLLPEKAPFVIINRSGGSATIGSRYVRDAKPDGYTLLLLHNAILTARYSGKVKYGPEAFEPVAATGDITMVVVVKDSSRFQTLKQLLEECKEKPDTITNGVNLGTPTHFTALKMEQAFPGAKFRYTQSGGGSDRILQLVGDHIEVSSFSVSEYVDFKEQGVRAIAFLGEERCDALPDVPTALEQGIDVVDSNMHYWWFPKGTPRECCDYIAEVLKKALQTDQIREELARVKMEPHFLQGQEFADYINQQVLAAQKVGQQEPPDVPDIPMGVGLALFGCIVVMFFERRSKGLSPSEDASRLPPSATWRTVGLFTAIAAYVVAMQYGVPFVWATVVFICCGGFLLSRTRRSHALILVETSLIVAFGVQFVLTKIVVTDLP